MTPSPTTLSRILPILSRVLSIIVGVWVGMTLGPVGFTFLFFFNFILGVPVGFVLGPILGGLWGNRNPLFRTAFAAFGVWVGMLIYVLGEKFLPLPQREITWFASPILGFATMLLLPPLAKHLIPEVKRESAAITAAVIFLVVPPLLTPLLHAFPTLLPVDQQQADNASAAQMDDFMHQADVEAFSALHLPSGRTMIAPQVTDKITFLRRSVPEICCPGVRAPGLKREVPSGDWGVALHYLTTATQEGTVRYYEGILGGKATKLPQSGKGSLPAVWQVTGTIRGIAITARIADIPSRGVGVVIY